MGEQVKLNDRDVDRECDNGAESDGTHTHPNTIQAACAYPSA